MYSIGFECVARWGSFSNRWAPELLDNVNCPYCGRLASYVVIDHMLDEKRNAISCSATCPGCRQSIRVWLVNPAPSSYPAKSGNLYLYPRPSLNRKPMEGVDKLPAGIGRAYSSAVAVFNAGVWSATAVCCRRVLEGIAKDLLQDNVHSGRLAQQLEDLKAHVDLARPLSSLADALRAGGNLGAHFDSDKEPDQGTAGRMVDFLEYLMEYLYVLPAEVESFRQSITKPNADAAAPETPASAA